MDDSDLVERYCHGAGGRFEGEEAFFEGVLEDLREEFEPGELVTIEVTAWSKPQSQDVDADRSGGGE